MFMGNSGKDFLVIYRLCGCWYAKNARKKDKKDTTRVKKVSEIIAQPCERSAQVH